MTHHANGGRIEVICGCMFSGKTEELIRRLNHVRIARQPLLAFTPRRDTRYRAENLVSHNGISVAAHAIESIAEIPAQIVPGTRVVAIDELHFLGDPPALTLSVCQELADGGLRVLVAGLDQDFRATPFPQMSQLMAVAEQVDKLFAICVRCGAFATRSQRLIDGEPAPFDAPTIAVGGLELYEARCRSCYERAAAHAPLRRYEVAR